MFSVRCLGTNILAYRSIGKAGVMNIPLIRDRFVIRHHQISRRTGRSDYIGCKFISHRSNYTTNSNKNKEVKAEIQSAEKIQDPSKRSSKNAETNNGSLNGKISDFLRIGSQNTRRNFISRIKWYLKKSERPFNTDDYSALFSWLVISNALMILLATTTFFSLVIFTCNTVFAQEYAARKIGQFLTKNSNMTVIFESAVVPGWRDGKISFRKCFVSRRPKASKKFIKGSQAEAYAASISVTSEEEIENEPIDDGNYTQFDLTIEEVNVSLSFGNWVSGTGIIETLEVKGMRGVVDRTHVRWEPNDDPRNYKNVYQPGDFEIQDFRMEDILFKLYQPREFRPFDVAIYNCELSKLRKNWLFYDFLNANIMNGAYDNSLFTVHRKQRLDDYQNVNEKEISSSWKRITRLRVDSLNIEHLNKGLEGPFGWITDGKVDMIADVMVPQDDQDLNLSQIVNLITDSIKNEVSIYNGSKRRKLANQKIKVPGKDKSDSKYLVVDLTLKLNNVRAMVPFKAPELTYINYAFISPIVAYINARNSFIEIKSRIVKNLEDFNGSWTIYDSLLIDDISEEVYDSFVDYVVDEEARLVRMRKFAFWSLQLFFQVIIIGLGTFA